MRIADLLGIALSALLQQKVRTLLTMVGVVIGTWVLVLSLSLYLGFEQEVMRQLNRGPLSRQVMVWPGSGVKEADIPPEKLQVKGRMSEAKRRRIRQAIINHSPVKIRTVQLNRSRLQELEQIPHVHSVVPLIQKYCQVTLKGRDPQPVLTFAADAANQHFRNRIVAGDYLSSDTGRSVVVSEYLLYLWKITDDDEVERVIGKKLRLEYHLGTRPRDLLAFLRGNRLNLSPAQRSHLEKALRELPGRTRPVEEVAFMRASALLAATPRGPLPLLAAWNLPLDGPGSGPLLFSEEFTIVGVLREFMQDMDVNDVFDLGAGGYSRNADVFLPARTAAELFSPKPRKDAFGFAGVVVTVDQEKNVKEVVHQVRRQGLREYSLVEFVQGLRASVVVGTFVTAFLAVVALLVAALGIINTMTMTVLERRHEIGVMKAVGARDRHILFIFLVEGALIGLIGGAVGLLLAWATSFPGSAIVRRVLHDQALPTLQHTLFVFPLWLTLGAPTFAGLITTGAALYPARGATRINPIEALRHE